MTEEIEQHILKKYEVVKKVGSGAYGHVWRVRDRKTGEIFALKKIFDAFQHSTDAQRTYRQIMFLRQFVHPNIVRLYHVLKAENDKDIYLVFEYMEADLHNAIREGILQDLHRQYVVYQCVLALKYLHSGEVIHRDLKPSNVLLNSSCKVKLCDFGLVRSVAKDDRASPILTEYVATRWYRAPQILLGSNEYSKGVDLWSLGCIIAEMVINKPIFPGNSTLHQLEKILSFTGKPSTQDIDSIKSQLAKTMIDSVSTVKYKNPKQWFPQTSPQLVDLIIKLLQFNPTKRLSCDELMNHPYIRHFAGKDPDSEFLAPAVFYVDKDQQKLTTKDYRNLIYQALRQDKQGRETMSSLKEDSKIFNEIVSSSKDKTVSPTAIYTSSKETLYKNGDKQSSKEALSTKDASPKKFATSTYTYTPSSNLKSKLDKQKNAQENIVLQKDRFGSYSSKISSSIVSQSLAEKYARIVQDKQKNEQKYIKPSTFYNSQICNSSYGSNIGVSYYSPKATYEKVGLPVKANSPTYKYTFSDKKQSSSGYSGSSGSYGNNLQKYKTSFMGMKDKS